MTDPASPVVPDAPAQAAPVAPPAAAPQAPAPAGAPRVYRAFAGTLLLNLISFAIVAIPSAHYFKLGLRLRGARTVAMMATIPWPFYLLALLAAVGLAVFALVLARRGEAPGSPRFRLLPIAAVLFVSAELFVVSPATFPFSSDALIASQLRAFEDGLVTDDGLLPSDPALFAKLTAEVRPPFLRDGKPMTGWNYVVRANCSGPVAELPAGVEAGTVIVCLAPDRRSGWVTAVGIDGEYAGPARLVSEPSQARPLVVRVQAVSADDARAQALDGVSDLSAGTVPANAPASPGGP